MISKLISAGRKVYLVFNDLEKAFNRVSRKLINDSLKNGNVSNKLRKAIMSVFDTTNNYVRTRNIESLEFEIYEN